VSTLFPEFDLLRKEIRAGAPGRITFFPKAQGVGNVDLSAEPAPTFTVHDRDGKQIGSQGTASVIQLGTAPDPVISRIECAIPALQTIEESYQCRISWRAPGESESRLEVVLFDVVLWPYDETTVGWHDLVGLRPECQSVLRMLAQNVGMTPEHFASVVGYHGREKLDRLLRDAIGKDELAYQSSSRGGTSIPIDTRYRHRVFLRGFAVLSRERLRPVELNLAMAELYARTMTGSPEEADSARALYDYYTREADMAWKSVGRLQYDLDGDDLVEDGEATNFSGVSYLQREQG